MAGRLRQVLGQALAGERVVVGEPSAFVEAAAGELLPVLVQQGVLGERDGVPLRHHDGAVLVGDDQVAGRHQGAADADGYVERGREQLGLRGVVRGDAGAPDGHPERADPGRVPHPSVDHDPRAAAQLEVAHEHVAEAAGEVAAVRRDDQHVAGLDGFEDAPQRGLALDVLLFRAVEDVLALRQELERHGTAGDLDVRFAVQRHRAVDERPGDAHLMQLRAGRRRAHVLEGLHHL